MNVVSFFSGIGGFELAGEWMGWNIAASCEINPFGQRVLKYYWPNAYHHDDVKTVDYEKIKANLNPEHPTVFVAGFPCQPFSHAGKRKGKEDDRYGWPNCIEAVRRLSPQWCVFENVSGLLSWNGGLVFNEVQADLEAEGYEVLPFLLPACAVNAPHRRDRIWFIAYAVGSGRPWGKQYEVNGCNRNSTGENPGILQANNFGQTEISGPTPNPASNRRERNGQGIEIEKGLQPGPGSAGQLAGGFEGLRGSGDVADTCNPGLQGSKINGSPGEIRQDGNKQLARCVPPTWDQFPTQPPLHRRDDGLSNKLAIFVVKEVKDEISKTSKENRIENLQEVWGIIQQEEVWQQIRGLYSLDSKDLLFQTMQLYSTGSGSEIELSPFCEEVSKSPLRTLQRYGEFRSSPQGQELQKQRTNQFGNSLSFLPHEVALAARAYTNSIRKFEAWHRQEAIKAYGNAIVPAVALQIFKAIQSYHETN